MLKHIYLHCRGGEESNNTEIVGIRGHIRKNYPLLFRDTDFTMAECGLVTEAKEALVLYGNGDILECTAKLKNIQKEILHVDR